MAIRTPSSQSIDKQCVRQVHFRSVFLLSLHLRRYHACVPDTQMNNRVGLSSRIWSYTMPNMDDVNEQTYTVSPSIDNTLPVKSRCAFSIQRTRNATDGFCYAKFLTMGRIIVQATFWSSTWSSSNAVIHHAIGLSPVRFPCVNSNRLHLTHCN
jgi:hypothetical protein